MSRAKDPIADREWLFEEFMQAVRAVSAHALPAQWPLFDALPKIPNTGKPNPNKALERRASLGDAHAGLYHKYKMQLHVLIEHPRSVLLRHPNGSERPTPDLRMVSLGFGLHGKSRDTRSLYVQAWWAYAPVMVPGNERIRIRFQSQHHVTIDVLDDDDGVEAQLYFPLPKSFAPSARVSKREFFSARDMPAPGEITQRLHALIEKHVFAGTCRVWPDWIAQSRNADVVLQAAVDEAQRLERLLGGEKGHRWRERHALTRAFARALEKRGVDISRVKAQALAREIGPSRTSPKKGE